LHHEQSQWLYSLAKALRVADGVTRSVNTMSFTSGETLSFTMSKANGFVL